MRKIVFVLLIAVLAIGVQTASAQNNSCVTVNKIEICGSPEQLAAVLAVLNDQGGGSAVAQAESATLEPTELPESEAGCFVVEGTLVEEVPCEAEASAFALDAGGGAAFDYTPRGENYALGVEPVGQGWTRIREGVDPGNYFSWNYFTRVSCDRPAHDGEIRWDRPIHLTVEPSIKADEREPMTCLIEVKRDLDSSTNWQTIGASMDPYDSSLNGQGDLLAWFVAGYADLSMDNGQQISLATEACSDPNDCPVPTFTTQPANGLVATPQWSAAAGGEGPKNVAVIREFPRNFEDSMWWLVTVNPGDSFKLWQGVYVPQPVLSLEPQPETATNQGGGANACSYTVVSGDTLGALANNWGMTVQDIQVVNDLSGTNIRVGQVLQVPGCIPSIGLNG